MVETRLDGLGMKSIRSYGLQGALGLLAGVGAGNIAAAFSGIIVSRTGLTLPQFFYQLIFFAVELMVVLAIYGAYIGYIFGGQERSSKLPKSGAAAGVLCGLAAACLFGILHVRGAFDPLYLTLAVAGLVYGAPKLRNMVLLAASGAIGGAAAYGIYVLGENLVYYLNEVWAQGGFLIIFAMLIFSIIATAVAGASIAIGMYFTEGTAYAPRDIPRQLKITRNAGLALTLLALFVSSAIFVGIARYASTEVSVETSSGSERVILYVPILLEEGQDVPKMYWKPSVAGRASTEIMNTERGKMLKLSGSGAFTVSMRQTDGKLAADPEANERFINGFTLSTSSASRYGQLQEADAWFYSEGEGSFSFSIKRDNGWGRVMIIRGAEKLGGGWQRVRLSVGGYWED